jgi:hypothetical protein
MVFSFKKKRKNKGTSKGIKIKTLMKETYGMIQYKTIQPDTKEEFYLLGYNVMQPIESQQNSQRNVSPPSSSTACYMLHACFLLGLFFDHEDGGDMFLRNIG